nr:protein kinase [uncultured Methanoregula sp.]
MSFNDQSIIADHLSKLEEIYKGKEKTEDWNNEKDYLKTILSNILDALPEYYHLIKPKFIGGTAVICILENKNLNFQCALKFPRPIKNKIHDFRLVINKEISHLTEVRHPNIVALYYHGHIIFDDIDKLDIKYLNQSFPSTENIEERKKLPFYVMEYIEGSENGEDFFNKTSIISEENLLKIIEHTALGIEQLHKKDIVHLDIKLENILIQKTPAFRAVISDLGSAQKLLQNGANDEKLTLIFDSHYASPDLVNISTKHSVVSPSSFKLEDVPRSKLQKAFDFHAFGKNIHRIFQEHDPGKDPKKWEDCDPYAINYLKLMACRLISKRSLTNEKALGLPCSDYHEILYENMSEVVKDVSKLTDEYQFNKTIDELDFHGKKAVQTAGLNQIATPFTPRVKEIIESPAFRRLSTITQLGFLNLVYPTANHSRLEHTLGTYSNTARYCDALYHDPYNPLFKQIMNENDFKILLLSSLFHDIGQYPLAHDVEEALAHESNNYKKNFSHIEILKKMFEKPENYYNMNELLKNIEKDWDVDSKRIISVITADPTKNNDPLKDRILHTIIDSPLDADKLDYLYRDSHHLGIPIGKAIDYERLLRTLTIIFSKEIKDNKSIFYYSLGIHEKGKVQAETLSFARYVMFGTAYWHHTSRAIKAMIHRSIWEIFYSHKKQDDEKQEIIFEDNFEKIKIFEIAFSDYIKGNPNSITPDKIDGRQSQLCSSDQQFITLLTRFTSPKCKKLVSLVEQRKLFKRLLVIRDNPGNTDELLVGFNKLRAKWNAKVAIKVSLELQDNLVKEFKERYMSNPKKIEKMGFSSEKIKELTDTMDNEIIILVDIPKRYSTDDTKLMYLPESDRDLTKWEAPVNLENSLISNFLQDSVLQSIGKMRIFIHPDVRNLIKSAIDDKKLVEIVENTINK